MKNAGREIRELEIPNETGDDGIVDVAVSFDGTWVKRGFTSLTGVVFVISVDAGKVLDYRCLSKACQKCSLKKSKRQNDDQFQEWQAEHHLVRVIKILMEAHKPWNVKELLHCGNGLLKNTIFATGGWLVTEIHSKAHSL